MLRDKNLKKQVPVPLPPEVVAEYNGSMGGVGLADMFISLYRTPYKCTRWYLHVLFRCVDICKVNAWALYRRQCRQKGIPKKKQMDLLDFTHSIIESLLKEDKCAENDQLDDPRFYAFYSNNQKKEV